MTTKDPKTEVPERDRDVQEQIASSVSVEGSQPAATGTGTETSSMAALKNVLDLVGKLIFGLAGLCYVLGVVVVTIHLRRYGVNSLDLPQLHYVTAGVWVVLPVAAILIFLIFAIFLATTQVENLRRKSSSVDKLGLFLGTGMAVIAVVTFFWRNVGIEFSWTNVVWIPLMGMFATVMILAGAVASKGITRSSPIGETLQPMGALIGGLILFAAYVLLFATHTYQAIPWATGGGRASQVRLFMAADSRPYVQGLKLTLAAQPQTELVETDSIKLLLTTDKLFVVLNADGKAVSVPADLVKGIAYEK